MSEARSTEERKILESRRASIIRYVLKNPNCTKADVIRHMKGRSSVNTTHAILISLINEGKIKKHEKNIQTHLLTLNDNNTFIKFYKEIEELNEVTKLGGEVYFKGLMLHLPTKLRLKYEGIGGLEYAYRQLFSIMVQILYRVAMTSSSSDQDFRLLDSGIKNVFLNLSMHGYDQNTTREVVDISSGKIKQFFQVLNKDKNKVVKIMDKDLEFGDKLIETIDKFKKEYSWVYRST